MNSLHTICSREKTPVRLIRLRYSLFESMDVATQNLNFSDSEKRFRPDALSNVTDDSCKRLYEYEAIFLFLFIISILH